MTSGVDQKLAFNRGVVDPLALARLDLSRLQLAAEIQTNYEPRALGPMALRPGLQFIGEVLDPFGDTAQCRLVPFVFSVDQTSLIELKARPSVTNAGYMRIWTNDEIVSAEANDATVTQIQAGLPGWTDLDEVGATSQYNSGYGMQFESNGTAYGIRQATVSGYTTTGAQTLQIVVSSGPITLRIGSTSGGVDYVNDYVLGTGEHNITYTPSGTYYIQIRSREPYLTGVSSIGFWNDAEIWLTTPWAGDDLENIRYVQSGDVIYLACEGKQQRKIERRANGSWSIVKYEPNDGPFRFENTTPTTLTSAALTGGGVQVTASEPIFRGTHDGAIFQVRSSGQTVSDSFSSANDFSNSIRVTGVGDSRKFGIIVSGTFTATVTLQRSFDDVTWEDVESYTIATTKTYDDGLDNQIIWYRIGVKTGDYTSGTVNVTLSYSLGSITGVFRIQDVQSTTTVLVNILSPLGSTTATEFWSEGLWSDFRGWPSSVEIHDGRLWWAGKDRFIGSITDAYESFDPDFEGDAGPIERSIGSGPIDNINWLLSLARLMAGTDSAEVSCRSSSFDEPLTPTNFTPKITGTQGCANVAAVRIDNRGVFAQRCGARVYELAYSIETQDYSESDLTVLCPRFVLPGVKAIAVQRQPDTRIHVVRTDGTVAVCVFDRAENLNCWYSIETDGDVEEVAVLPDAEEDAVYYVVNRTIEGVERRYLERFALRSECEGGTVNKQLDSFVTFSGTSTPTAAHLDAKTVRVWADGGYVGQFTADANGQVTLPAVYTSGVMGLPYTAQFKSAKLAYTVPPGKSGLGARKKISQLGLVLQNTHPDGITFGGNFTTMDSVPRLRQGEDVGTNVMTDYEEVLMTFPSGWHTDARLCLQTEAPYPCTVLAAVIDMETHAK